MRNRIHLKYPLVRIAVKSLWDFPMISTHPALKLFLTASAYLRGISAILRMEDGRSVIALQTAGAAQDISVTVVLASASWSRVPLPAAGPPLPAGTPPASRPRCRRGT